MHEMPFPRQRRPDKKWGGGCQFSGPPLSSTKPRGAVKETRKGVHKQRLDKKECVVPAGENKEKGITVPSERS